MAKLFQLILFTFLCLTEGGLTFIKGDFSILICNDLGEEERLCNECALFHLGLCYSGMRNCLLATGQKCATENFFIIPNSGLVMYHFSKLSCKTYCTDRDFTGHKKRIETICCDDKDNCNYPEGN